MNKQRKEKIKRRKALQAWSLIVRSRDNDECQICGSKKNLNAHHIIPKEIREFNYIVQNGICLCVRCHKWGMESAHKNGFYFINWFRENRPSQYAYLMKKYK